MLVDFELGSCCSEVLLFGWKTVGLVGLVSCLVMGSVLAVWAVFMGGCLGL